jgi:hypothetical protein
MFGGGGRGGNDIEKNRAKQIYYEIKQGIIALAL